MYYTLQCQDKIKLTVITVAGKKPKRHKRFDDPLRRARCLAFEHIPSQGYNFLTTSNFEKFF